MTKFHITEGTVNAVIFALEKTFPIYNDPESGTDVDSDAVTILDALRDYKEGYVVVPLSEIREKE